jgi:hypothetical protein
MRAMVELLRTCYQVSIRRATQTLPAPRATLYYRSRKAEQAPLRHRIKEIAAIRVRYGYRRIHTLLQREGWGVNHKRVLSALLPGRLADAPQAPPAPGERQAPGRPDGCHSPQPVLVHGFYGR